MKINPVIALFAAALVFAASCASAPPKAPEAAAPAPAAPAAPAVAAPAPAAPAAAAPAAVVDLQPYKSASKDCYAMLEKATALAAQGKWKSAVAAIDAFDKDSADPFALALKTNLLMMGAVGNDVDRAFAVVDLEPGQDLDTLRQSGQEYDLVEFDPPALAAAQTAKGVAAPPVLSLGLGDYYYDVLTNFQDSWDTSPFEIAVNAAGQYKAAFAGGLYTLASLKKQAELYSGLEQFEEAEPVYKKIIELDPKDPLTHYGYAISLQKRDKPAEMLAELDLAIAGYGDSQERLGVVALASKTAYEQGDAARSEAYLAKTDKELAGTALAGMLRHFVAVSVGNKEAAEAAAGKIVDEYGKDNATVRDMIVIWYQAGASADAVAFIDKRLAKGGDSLAVANLEFFKAVLLLQEEMSDDQRAVAMAALDDAEKRMKAALPADDPIFASVASVREALTPPPAQEPTANPEAADPQAPAAGSAGTK